MDYRRRDSNSNDRPLVALVERIVGARSSVSSARALVVGISGIDGSGKGYITAQVSERLRARGWNVAVIAADDWLNLPEVCINRENFAEHFYERALRLNEMFDQLVLPLKRRRAVDLVADCGGPTATNYYRKRHLFSNIEIVLIEGIFLFKPAYRDHFDLRIWINCSFETALRRAIARGQEGLPPSETRKAFEAIYVPAQRIHIQRDRPQETADVVFSNDSQRRSRLKRPRRPERAAR